MGLLSAIAVVILYQLVQVFQWNSLHPGRRAFPRMTATRSVPWCALNTTYFANFGAELAVVSMLPMFFEETWASRPPQRGWIASTFAFVNLFARPMGGLVSDRFGNRRFVMLAYMLGIAVGFALMGLMTASGRSSLPWPSLWAARSSCRVQTKDLRHHPWSSAPPDGLGSPAWPVLCGTVGAVCSTRSCSCSSPPRSSFSSSRVEPSSAGSSARWPGEPEGGLW